MREIAWIRAALKDFRKFPKAVQDRMLDALAVASFGQKADLAKPMKHLGSGVMEIALPYRSDAYRVVYAVQLGDVDIGFRSTVAELPEGERELLFSGHSLRAGLASSADIEERYVQKQLGHASAEMTRKYQRRRDRFRTNLTKASGL